MRTTRAYLASLGTTGLLVLSSVLVLVVGGALFAFDGWPGGSNGDEPETVVVQAAPTASGPGTGPEAIAEAAAPAAETVADAAFELAAETPATGESDNGGDGDGPATPRGEGEDTPAVPPTGTPTDPTGTPPGNGPGGGGGGDVTPVDGLADGVESTTTFLGQDVVGQIAPDLGTLVTQAGQGLTDLVRALDGTPPAPR